MIGPDSTERGLLVDWDLDGLKRARLYTLLIVAKSMRGEAHKIAAGRDSQAVRLRDRQELSPVFRSEVHSALGDALALVRHLDRQSARITERLRALEGK